LPSAPLAKQTLMQSPVAAEALAQRRAIEARADAVATGSAEFNLRGMQQRRRTSDNAGRFNEHSVAIERPLRAWGKAGLDAEVAAQTRVVADIGQADAMHEASRALMRRWFDWLKAQSDQQLAHQQVTLSQQLAQQTQARFRHGEVSQLDVSLAQADLRRTQAVFSQAQALLTQSRTTLRSHYPGLPLPNELLPAPLLTAEGLQTVALPVTGDLPAVKATYLEHNHELRLLRADAKRLALVSERVTRDRLPDPTVGLFTANERDGAERIHGVTIAFPLSGGARSALAQAAIQDAMAADQRLRTAEAQWSAHFDTQTAWVAARLKSAQNLQEAARAQTDAAQKAAKAYALGEHTMAELIQIQRNAAEQSRDAMRQTLEAIEVWANLQLDLHLFWDMDD
jgi:cobalt-zinc-cadmium efflux system outer membrane protein